MNCSEKLCEKACYCMTVSSLRELLDDLCEDGYSDSCIAFRVGRSDDGQNAVCLPIADIRVDPFREKVLLTPAARIHEVNGVAQPDFDFIVSFNEDNFSVKLEDLTYEEKGE